MASSQNVRDLQWVLQVINSGSLNLHSISFYLSQSTSGCHQETENSLNINISKESLSYFSSLLAILGSAKNSSSLRNLEFHDVEWELQHVRDLGVSLENSSSIKQLVFQRNRFSVECLSGLSEIMRKNRVIKEIMLCESSIGPVGAGLLASALKVNGSLEELQIWEDSIGSKGAEELSKMIEVNSTLKLLTIFDSNSLTATPLISAVLARNRSMEVHIWSGHNHEKSFKVVEFVPENSTLRIYRLDVSGACRVACALGCNSTVRSLDMTGVHLKSRWAKEFRWVLEQNRCLKEINLSKTCLKDKGVVYVAAGLFKNQSLESLYLDGNWFGATGVEHLLCPLSRFSSLQNQANVTLQSLIFGGGRTKIGRDGFAAILQMLSTNQTLTSLGIYDDESLRPDDIIKIFKCLERNATLRCLSLKGCKGVDGDLVLQTIIGTLQVNPWIEDIDLARTPLQKSGKTEVVYQRLGQNERTEPDIDLLKDMPMTAPKSCRVFLCGQEYAGNKTSQSGILLGSMNIIHSMISCFQGMEVHPFSSSLPASLGNLISISINGIYVRIELGGELGYYIDVLTCSTKHLTETLRLFQQLIIPAIQSLCHGVTLIEHVLRPECVRNLIAPRYRKDQFVPLQQLKQALLSVPADSMYDYQHTWGSVTDSGKSILSSGFDYARDLLSDDDFREVLHCRYNDLHILALELQVPHENNTENSDHASLISEGTNTAVEPTFAGIAKGVEVVLERLKIIEQEIRDIKQEIQGLRYYEHRLLMELHRKVNFLVNYNVQLEERKVPNLFYFVRTENYSRRLVTTIFSGMTALRIHMLCEFRREMHVVEDQIGCEMMQIDNRAVKCLAPHMKKFMKLLTFALKIGAHLAAGMGQMIPDLSKEISHLVDSPMLYGAAAAGFVGAAAVGGRNRSSSSRDIQQDLRAAQQWVVDFLREQSCSTGKEIAEKFGLWRVRYRDDGQIGWVCRRHLYSRANEIIEVPI